MHAIQEAIGFLDAHSAFAMVLLTLAYVIMTVLILKEIRRTNTIAQDLDRARNRPFVVFYLESKDGGFHAILKNFGPQPAFEVRTIIEPAILRRGEPDNELSVAKSVLPMLAPGEPIDDFMGATHTYLKRHADQYHKVAVYYKDAVGTEYSAHETVSVEHYRTRITARRETVEDKIARAFVAVQDSLRHIAESTAELKWTINNAVNLPSPPHQPTVRLDELGSAYDLTEDELEYLSNIREPPNEGAIYCAIALDFEGEEPEKYYEMVNRLLTLGYLRKELDRLVLTDRAYTVMRQRMPQSPRTTAESVRDQRTST